MSAKSSTVTINGDDPFIIALDTTASMNTADAPDGLTRLASAKQHLAEVLKRLPAPTKVTVLTVGAGVQAIVADATALDARAALWLIDAAAARADFGRALEWAVLETSGPATVVVVADAGPDDQPRYDAWRAYDQAHGARLNVVELNLADAPGLSPRGLEWAIKTRTQSDKPEAAKAPTIPPSISPPSRVGPVARPQTKRWGAPKDPIK